MSTQVRQREGGVEHHGPPGLGRDGAGVADLAAGLGIERGAVEEDVDRAVALTVTGPAIDRDHGQHPALGHVVRVAEELGHPELVDDVTIRVEIDALTGPLLCGLGPITLGGHVGTEPVEVDA